MLQEYDMIPVDMRRYLRNYGRHFSKKACDYAVGMMRKKSSATGRMERIEALSKDSVDTLLKDNGTTLDHAKGYDYVYIANMCKADFYGTAIDDDAHMAKYIKCVIDDPDGCDGIIFNRWIADCDSIGIPIDWEELL